VVAVRASYCRGSTAALALLALLAWAPAARAQALAMHVAGDAVRVRAPGWSFLDGEPLGRLKDGRTVRVELVATALPGPGRSPIAAARQILSVSYDLWEERFAVAIAGTRAASISHLTLTAAEAWCVDQMGIPIASLGSPTDLRFWIRLEVRVLDGDGTPDPDADAGLTLQRLIDVLSRRRKNESPARTIEGGPFRLPPR
jgi:hypothetical protein